MNSQTLKTASIKELKLFATENNILVDGDKRKKDSYVVAISIWLEDATNIKVSPVDYFISEDEFTVLMPSDSLQPIELIEVKTQLFEPSISKFLLILPLMIPVFLLVLFLKTAPVFLDGCLRALKLLRTHLNKSSSDNKIKKTRFKQLKIAYS